MATGDPSPNRGEVVIPKLLADKGGVTLGGSVMILGEPFSVVGLSKGTFSMANSVVFLNYGDMEWLLAFPGAASYLLVTASTGVSSESLVSRIEYFLHGVSSTPPNGVCLVMEAVNGTSKKEEWPEVDVTPGYGYPTLLAVK